MVHVKKEKVALNLQEKSVPEKIQFGRHVVTKMSGNPNFGGGTPINPPLADVTTSTDNVEEAWDERKNVEEGTAVVHEKETAFDNVLTPLGHYVEDVANENPATAKSVIKSAGMEVKDEGEPVGDLDKPVIKKVASNETIGELEIDWDKVDNARNYSLRAYTDEADPEGSNEFRGIFSKSKATVEDLPSGEKVHVQVRAHGGDDENGPWSDAAWARPR
jgi:hypothetical protein